MSTLEIGPLPPGDEPFRRLIVGYTSAARYRVAWLDGDDGASFSLRPEPMKPPLIRPYDHLDDATLARYRDMAAGEFGLGARLDGELVGLALAEPQRWNGSLWVWELHVAEAARRRGVGARLMTALETRARAAGLRVMVCETQTTNMPAILFYRRQGFRLEGLDLSYYSNADWPDGEVAVFLKKQL